MSLIGKNVGNYLITAQLGEGGMGTVYLGEHPLIGKKVAVKVLLEELAAKEEIVSRFFTEAKSVNDIGHQNIVDIVDFGKMKNDAGHDTVYFIMEYLDGQSVADRLRTTGVTLEQGIHIGQQCCSALTASHAKGIVHRDLKPDNIYLCHRGTDSNFVKILDFGIAKLTGDGGTSSHKTRTGLVIGTPAYMSPEQCEGKGLIDHRSDVYALGVVMYELLTGQVPFPGEGFGEILVAHLTREVPRLTILRSDIPPEIEAIVMHALEKDKNRRFQSMKEFSDALTNPQAHWATYQELPAYAGGQVSGTQIGSAPMGAVGARSTSGFGRPESTGERGAPPTGSQPLTSSQFQGPLSDTPSRPTTLSGAASSVEGFAPERKRRTPLVAMVVGIILVVGLGIAGLATRTTAPKVDVVAARPAGSTESVAVAPTPPKPAAAQAAAHEKVSVTIATGPQGAKIVRPDAPTAVLGTTPHTFELEKGEPPFEVQLLLDGYQPATRKITTDKTREVEVALVKAKKDSTGTPRPRPRREAVEGSGDQDLMRPRF